MANYWSVPWLLFGDFNTVRLADERNGDLTSRREMCDFNSFIEEHGLVELKKIWAEFLLLK